MVSPTIQLLLWALYSQHTSAQTSLITSIPPVPSSLVTQITPAADTSSSVSLSASLSASLSESSLSEARNSTVTSSSLSSSTTPDIIGITGTPNPSPSSNGTSTTAANPARPSVNTTPCNGYPEFCNRKFSNVSMVVAHNSPFVKPHNAASNQDLPVLTQLQDGIRGCMCSRTSCAMHRKDEN
jgi:hypothetical protein